MCLCSHVHANSTPLARVCNVAILKQIDHLFQDNQNSALVFLGCTFNMSFPMYGMH